MKKRIIGLFLGLILCFSMLAGCDFVTTNEDIDLNRVLIKVGDEEYSDKITKRDYLATFWSAGYSYIEQGYSVDDVMEYVYNLLTQNRVSVQVSIKAIIEDYTQKGWITATDKVSTLTEVLTKPTKEQAVDLVSSKLKILVKDYEDEKYADTNYNTAWNEAVKSEQDAIKQLVEQIKLEEDEDYESPAVEEEEEKRATRTESENAKEAVKIETTAEELQAQRNVMANKEELIADGFIEGDEFFSADEVATIYEKAYARYEKQIKDADIILSYKDKYVERYFELLMVEKLEQQCVQIYNEIFEKETIQTKFSVGENGTALTATDSLAVSQMGILLKNRFEALQLQQKQQFELDPNAYITALEELGSDTFLLASAEGIGGYGYVKHILIPLGEVESFMYQQAGALAITEQEKLEYRRQLLQTVKAKDLREENEDVGFVPYDQEMSINDYYDFFKQSFGSEATSNPEVFRVTQTPDYTAPNDVGYKDDGTAVAPINGEYALATDKFIDWIFTWNTDGGMFNNSVDYLINKTPSPYLANDTYMKEFSKAARDVISIGEGAYTLIATDYGWHLVYCSEVIFDDAGDLQFNEAILQKIKDGTTNFADEQDAVYKIYKTIKESVVATAYSEAMTEWVEKYENSYDGNFVEKNQKLYTEIVNQMTE